MVLNSNKSLLNW
ncbi:UNVERIFIED_CONTAM: hypothetical protein GTU68_016217 [Idotea baltica]|nr:hypothetical protein [Idotea baltica]